MMLFCSDVLCFSICINYVILSPYDVILSLKGVILLLYDMNRLLYELYDAVWCDSVAI